MKTKARITSILESAILDSSITGLPSFNLSALNLESGYDFELPTHLRLGHLAEKIVSELIKSSSNYNVIHENVQVIEDKQTIGEVDFIIEELKTKTLTHVELAYKFYLFDPSISDVSLHNWIGPNRNDSLKEKLNKLKLKQFPLLYRTSTRARFNELETDQISQALCLMASLFIPYKYEANFDPAIQNAIKGYYLNLQTFKSLDQSDHEYYIPPKKEWGMDPSKNQVWTDFKGVEKEVITSLNEEQALLCWQKYKETYLAFFIVWW